MNNQTDEIETQTVEAVAPWIYTSYALPMRHKRVEWIALDGRRDRGRFAGDGTWLPEGLPAHTYFTPRCWRYLESIACVHNK